MPWHSYPADGNISHLKISNLHDSNLLRKSEKLGTQSALHRAIPMYAEAKVIKFLGRKFQRGKTNL
jgi:hypothetical protein